MALCERCDAELQHGLEPLPARYFDSVGHAILNGDGRVSLSPLPWRVLNILWHRRRQFTRHATLVMLLYSGPEDIDEPETGEAVMKVHVTRVRKALKGLPFSIICQYNFGYRLVENDLGLYPEVGPLEPCDGPQPAFKGKYPLRVMHIGQSFVVRDGDMLRIKGAIAEAHRKVGGRFARLQEPGQIRVTRLPD
jgi:hypothetical protein